MLKKHEKESDKCFASLSHYNLPQNTQLSAELHKEEVEHDRQTTDAKSHSNNRGVLVGGVTAALGDRPHLACAVHCIG